MNTTQTQKLLEQPEVKDLVSRLLSELRGEAEISDEDITGFSTDTRRAALTVMSETLAGMLDLMTLEVELSVVQYGTCTVSVVAEDEEEAEALAMKKFDEEVKLSDVELNDIKVEFAGIF